MNKRISSKINKIRDIKLFYRNIFENSNLENIKKFKEETDLI